MFLVRTAGDEKPNSSFSGEARLSRVFLESERRHTLHFNLRGKSTQNAYGGNVSRFVGAGKYYDPVVLPAPDWAPGPRGPAEFLHE